jgi:hypothetical protein
MLAQRTAAVVTHARRDMSEEACQPSGGLRALLGAQVQANSRAHVLT